MKALVKAAGGARHLDGGHPGARRSATTTCSSRSPRPPSAAPTCTSTTGTPGRRRRSRCRWRWVTSTAGDIVEIGSEVRGFKTGDRVSGEGHITCGHCRNCRAGRRHLCRNTVGVGVNRPGAFAEYLAIPGGQRLQAPDSIADDIASILDPFGNATHTALAFNLVGEDVLITGAGPIGIMAVGDRALRGARHVVITDVNDYRLELARKMGATRAINVHARVARSDHERARHAGRLRRGPRDVGQRRRAFARCCAPCTTAARSPSSAFRPSETAIDWNQVIFKGLTIKGIYGREMFETWYKMASLLQSGLKLEPIITHHFPVQEYPPGLRDHGLGQVRQGDPRLVDALRVSLAHFAEAVRVQAVGHAEAAQALRPRA